MEPLEIEVKFFITDFEPVRLRLIRMGARSRGRVFETNIRFEDRQKNLIKKNILLRLRKDNRVLLTYKSPPDVHDENYKIYNELEVEVNDFEKMKSILKALGYNAEQIYEKYREIMVLDHTHFCLDAMPFGNFLEIEGERENIAPMAEKLGFDWKKRILLNYLKMFEIIKKREKFNFSHVTFHNFEQVTFNISDYLPDFYAKSHSQASL